MEFHKQTIGYEAYHSLEQLSEFDYELAQAAIESAKKAYAPYSGFCVGTALKLGNGKIVSGNNQENAAYPSGMCAERVALFYAGAEYPGEPIVAMAVVAIKDDALTDEVISPCGGCRQVIVETAHRNKRNFPIILIGKNKVIKIGNSTDLLPFLFGPDSF